MATQPSLEDRLYGTYWDDGLLDILYGAALLIVGLGWALGFPLSAVAPPLLVPLWGPLRRRFVEPHAGFVAFTQGRQDRTRRGMLAVLALGIGVLVVAVGTFLALRTQPPTAVGAALVQGLPAVLLGVGTVLGGILCCTLRFHLYGVLLLLAGFATVLLDAGPALPLLAGGGAAVVTGAIRLGRFLSDSARFHAAP